MAITIKDITELPSGLPDANEPLIFGRGTNLFTVTRDELFALISQGITDLSFRLIESNNLYDENSGVNILNNVDITIGAGELVFFNVDVIDANQTLSNNTYLIPLSSGVYNPLGATLTIDDLYLLKKEVLNNNFGGDANTVTYTESTLADVNNASPALDFSDSDLIYFLELDNGFYRFNGVNGLYGSGELQMTFNDLIQVGQAEITQESIIVTLKVNEQTKAEAVSQFNSMQPPVNIKDISSVKIRAILYDFTVTPIQVTTRIYSLISKPYNDVELTNGIYGAIANQITANHLLIDYETESSSEDVQASANEVIDLGDIDPDDIITFINSSLTGIVIQDSASAITLIKSIQSGFQTDYIYIGSGGTYGANDSQITASELQLLEQDTPGLLIDDSFSDTSTNPLENKVISTLRHFTTPLAGTLSVEQLKDYNNQHIIATDDLGIDVDETISDTFNLLLSVEPDKHINISKSGTATLNKTFLTQGVYLLSKKIGTEDFYVETLRQDFINVDNLTGDINLNNKNGKHNFTDKLTGDPCTFKTIKIQEYEVGCFEIIRNITTLEPTIVNSVDSLPIEYVGSTDFENDELAEKTIDIIIEAKPYAIEVFYKYISGGTVLSPNALVLIYFYQYRIYNDGGTFENEDCLKEYLKLIQ